MKLFSKIREGNESKSTHNEYMSGSERGCQYGEGFRKQPQKNSTSDVSKACVFHALKQPQLIGRRPDGRESEEFCERIGGLAFEKILTPAGIGEPAVPRIDCDAAPADRSMRLRKPFLAEDEKRRKTDGKRSHQAIDGSVTAGAVVFDAHVEDFVGKRMLLRVRPCRQPKFPKEGLQQIEVPVRVDCKSLIGIGNCPCPGGFGQQIECEVGFVNGQAYGMHQNVGRRVRGSEGERLGQSKEILEKTLDREGFGQPVGRLVDLPTALLVEIEIGGDDRAGRLRRKGKCLDGRVFVAASVKLLKALFS